MSVGKAPGRVAIVIVNYRTPDLAIRCLRSLAADRAAVPDMEAIIVDGGSGDGSAERLADALRDPAFTGWASLIALPINGGFGWANNQAMLGLLQRADPPDYIHLLNPDTEIEAGAVRRLADHLDGDDRCGAVGSLLLDPDGTPSGSAFRFPSIGREFLRGCATPMLGRLLQISETLAEDNDTAPDWVTGASVMLRAEALRQSGLFDDGFFLYFEEVELMWRLRQAGWRIAFQRQSRVFHVGGAATGVRVTKATRRPAYWFDSRRRFLLRTRGAAGLWLATIGWIAGRAVWRLREMLRLTKRQPAASPETADHLRRSFIIRTRDRRNAVTRWNDPIGRPPAWMDAR